MYLFNIRGQGIEFHFHLASILHQLSLLVELSIGFCTEPLFSHSSLHNSSSVFIPINGLGELFLLIHLR